MDVEIKPAPQGPHGEDAIEIHPFPVAAGAEVTSVVEPQNAFLPTGLILDEPAGWLILEITVGRMLQNRLPIFAMPLAELAGAGVLLRLDVVHLAMQLMIRARNVSDTTAVLAGKWIGKAIR